MSADRDVTRIVRSWLEEGRTALPDRVLDAVLDQLPATPQRRAPWPARRFGEMNTTLKVVIAAAAVMIVALVGITLLPKNGGVGGSGPGPTGTPAPIPSPTQAPSASSASNVNFTGTYAAGATYAIDNPCCVAPSGMTFTIPAAGWYAPLEEWRIGKNVPGGSDIFDLYVKPHFVDNVYTGGCHWRGTELDPPVGPTVDDLATALVAQAGPGAPPAASVTVGGHPGKKVDLSLPSGVDVSRCDSDGDQAIFGRFVSDLGNGAQPYTHGLGQVNTFYIVDVDGSRQVIDAMYLPGTSAADRAELDQIVASIRFGSSPPGPSRAADASPTAGSAEVVRGWPDSIGDSNPPGRYSWDPDGRAAQDARPHGDTFGWMRKNDSHLTVTFRLSDTTYGPGPTAVTVGGYEATYKEVEVNSQDVLKEHVWIVDIGGTPVTIAIATGRGATAANLAEAMAIVDSIRLEPTQTTTGFRLSFDLLAGWDSG